CGRAACGGIDETRESRSVPVGPRSAWALTFDMAFGEIPLAVKHTHRDSVVSLRAPRCGVLLQPRARVRARTRTRTRTRNEGASDASPPRSDREPEAARLR